MVPLFTYRRLMKKCSIPRLALAHSGLVIKPETERPSRLPPSTGIRPPEKSPPYTPWTAERRLPSPGVWSFRCPSRKNLKAISGWERARRSRRVAMAFPSVLSFFRNFIRAGTL